MAGKRQSDNAQSSFFEDEEQSQGELFGKPKPYRYQPDLGKVRERLHGFLRRVRKWEAPPPDWTGEFSSMKVSFPSLARHLPEEEAAELLAAFKIEVARLTEAAIKRNFPPEIEWGRVEIDMSPWKDDEEY